MNRKNRLIICEGQDRAGKNFVFDQLKNTDLKNELFFYERPFPPNKPSYRTQPDEFKQWADNYITTQTNELISTKRDTLMVRFLLSDLVYSTIFNRPTIIFDLLEKLEKYFIIHNEIFLFKDYNEYLERLIKINEPIEYQEDEFYNVMKLYENLASQISPSYSIYRTSKPNCDSVFYNINAFLADDDD